MDVIIQNKRPKALSVSAAPSQLSQRESQGCLFDSTRKDGTVTEKHQLRPPICHSDRSASGVEESTTWDNESPQDKIRNLRGFLDSLRFARNDMSGAVFSPIGYTSNVAGGKVAAPTFVRPDAAKKHPFGCFS